LKIDRAFSLDLGLKVEKIARNVTKVGVCICLATGHQIYAQFSIPRSWSNSKLDRAFSLDLSLKGVKLACDVTKVGVRICLPTGDPNLCSVFNSEKLVKFETRPCVFTRLGLKGGENSSERHES
jgi:hypothetical protein